MTCAVYENERLVASSVVSFVTVNSGGAEDHVGWAQQVAMQNFKKHLSISSFQLQFTRRESIP